MGLAGALGGAICIGLVGALRHYRGVNETISSLLIAYITIAIMNQMVEGPLRDPASLTASTAVPNIIHQHPPRRGRSTASSTRIPMGHGHTAMRKALAPKALIDPPRVVRPNGPDLQAMRLRTRFGDSSGRGGPVSSVANAPSGKPDRA